MIEILKVIVEFLSKNLSLRDLLLAKDKKKKASLGAELFFLYTQLNEIYTLGILIVAELEAARERLERYVRENRKDDYHIGHDLKYMLDQQYINILRVARSLRRLNTELQVINADMYATIVPLLHSKASIISRMLCFEYGHGIYRPALTFCDPDKLDEILKRSREFFKDKPHEWSTYMGWEMHLIREEDFGATGDRLDRLWSVDAAIEIKAIRLDNDGALRVDELPLIQEYLDKRKPREQLDLIKKCIADMRQSLLEHFDIMDVLVDVGKARGVDRESYLW